MKYYAPAGIILINAGWGMATLVVCFQKEGRRQQKGIQQQQPKPADSCHQVWSKAETQSIQAAFEVNKASAKAGHCFQTSQFKEDRDCWVMFLRGTTRLFWGLGNRKLRKRSEKLQLLNLREREQIQEIRAVLKPSSSPLLWTRCQEVRLQNGGSKWGGRLGSKQAENRNK